MDWDFGEERDNASTSALANQAIGGEYPPSSALRLTRVSALSLQDFGTRYWDLTCSLTSNTLDNQVWLAKCKTLALVRNEPCRKKIIWWEERPGLSTENIELRNWETTRLRHIEDRRDLHRRIFARRSKVAN